MVAEGTGAKLNRLLIRYVVGKSRETSYDLPGLGFTYGNKPKRTEESAGNIIFSWVAGEKSKKKKKGKDIIYENRMANINGCINTKQANEWRDAYRARKEAKEAKRRELLLKIQADEMLGVEVKKEDKEAVEEGPKKPWEGDICFGSISVPSEPVGKLLIGLGNVEDPTYADLSGQQPLGVCRNQGPLFQICFTKTAGKSPSRKTDLNCPNSKISTSLFELMATFVAAMPLFIQNVNVNSCTIIFTNNIL